MYKSRFSEYSSSVDVSVTELRAHLAIGLDSGARAGGVSSSPNVDSDRTTRCVDSTDTLERLTAEGVIGKATRAALRSAAGRPRPRPQRPVSDRVSDQRR